MFNEKLSVTLNKILEPAGEFIEFSLLLLLLLLLKYEVIMRHVMNNNQPCFRSFSLLLFLPASIHDEYLMIFFYRVPITFVSHLSRRSGFIFRLSLCHHQLLNSFVIIYSPYRNITISLFMKHSHFSCATSISPFRFRRA